MSNCTCGRTTRYPLCDGSHRLSEEEYKERTERLNNLFTKDIVQPSTKDKEIIK